MSAEVRRRGLMAAPAEPSPIEWDEVWEFTNGLPSNWSKSGADTPSMTSNGLDLKRVQYSQNIEISSGAIEGNFLIINERDTMAGTRAILRIGNASQAICVAFNQYSNRKSIVLTDYADGFSASNLNAGTVIGTWTLGSEYVVRIIINDATGSVYINGVLAADNINTAGMYNKGPLLWGNSNQYPRSRWKYVKFQKTR